MYGILQIVDTYAMNILEIVTSDSVQIYNFCKKIVFNQNV